MELLSRLKKPGAGASSPISFPPVIKDKVKGDERYARWVENHRWTPRMEKWCRKQMEHFAYRPTVGILMQCISPREEFLRESLSSIFNQIYPFVEFSIVDRGSVDPKVRALLQEVEKDARVKVLYQKGTERDITLIAKIMKKTSVDYLLLTGAEDVLEPYALYNMVAVMQGAVELDFVYSDSDLLDENGLRFEPQFKPQWAVGAHYPLGYYQHPVLLHERVIVKMRGHERVSVFMENGELLDEASNHSKQALQAAGILAHARHRGAKNETPPKAEFSVLMNENLIKEDGKIVIDTEVRSMAEPRVPLRILWWVDSLEQNEKSEMLLQVARYLVKHSGHKITVLTPQDGPLRKQYQEIATVEVAPSANERVQKLHQEIPFDASLIAGKDSVFPALLSKLDLPSVWHLDAQRLDFVDRFNESFSHPETITLPTKELLERFRPLDSRRVLRLLPSCVDLDEIKLYKQKHSPIQMREDMKIAKDSAVITITGPTIPQKGQKMFVEAAILLQKKLPNRPMDFFIVGERPGPYLDEIKDMILGSTGPERFHLIPEGETRPHYYPYLWISNVYVSCSAEEIYPHPILEAMAFKKAVVATNVSGTREVMEDASNGFLVPTNMPEDLARRLEELIQNVPLMDDCARRSLEIVMEKFHIKKIATRLENLLREGIVTQ